MAEAPDRWSAGDFDMRPAWPDESPRVRLLLGELVPGAHRGTGAHSEQSFVMVKTRPVERLTGAIVWGEKRADSGTAFFQCWILPAYQAGATRFLDAFRRHVLEENAGRYHSLCSSTLHPEGAPELAVLADAGFAEGLVNETYAFKFSVGLARTARSRERFGHRDLPPGSRLAAPERAHLPALRWLCCELHDLIAPALLDAAVEDGDPLLAGFHPAISLVYLEGDEVMGTMLAQARGGDVEVTARVVAPQASAPAGLICQKLFERWTELLIAFNNPVLVHLRANPAIHQETVRLALRYRGWRTARFVRMDARRARRTHAFCIGNARCGTTTLASLLDGPLRSGHEPGRAELIQALRRRRNGEMSEAELDAFLVERDRRLGLEFESSTFLFFVIDRLVALFPQARFVTLVRHPAEWATRSSATCDREECPPMRAPFSSRCSGWRTSRRMPPRPKRSCGSGIATCNAPWTRFRAGATSCSRRRRSTKRRPAPWRISCSYPSSKPCCPDA